MLTLVLTLSLTACGDSKEDKDASSASSEESDIAYVKDKGSLVIGITDFEPMDYKDVLFPGAAGFYCKSQVRQTVCILVLIGFIFGDNDNLRIVAVRWS